MIFETGLIVAIEPQGLWVETIQISACGSCQAQKGCGHSLLAKFGASASHIWVLLDGRRPDAYQINDQVRIGVPEDVVARGALFIYLVPLAAMLVATLLAHQQQASDGASALAAFAGLLLGAAIVRLRSYQIRFDKRLQPVLVDDQTPMQTVTVRAVAE